MGILRCVVVAALALSAATPGEPGGTSYYAGTRTIRTADGHAASGLEVAVALTFAPADSSISERIVSGPLGDSPAPIERVVVIRVSGTTFRATDRERSFSGEGTMRGAAWSWSGWDGTNRMENGVVLELSDSLIADSLVSHQRLYDPAHNLIATIVDRLARTDSARFGAVRARILGR